MAMNQEEEGGLKAKERDKVRYGEVETRRGKNNGREERRERKYSVYSE